MWRWLMLLGLTGCDIDDVAVFQSPRPDTFGADSQATAFDSSVPVETGELTVTSPGTIVEDTSLGEADSE